MEAKWRTQRPRKPREKHGNTIETQHSQTITQYDHQEGKSNRIDNNMTKRQREWMHLGNECISEVDAFWRWMCFEGGCVLGMDASIHVICVR